MTTPPGPGPSSLGLFPISSRPMLRHAHPRGGGRSGSFQPRTVSCLQPSSAATYPSTGGGPGPPSLGLSPVSSRPPLRHAHPRGGEVRVLPASDCLLSPAVLRCDMPIHGGGGEVRVLPASTVSCLQPSSAATCPSTGGGGGGRSGSFQPRTVSCLQSSSAATCPSTGGRSGSSQPRTVSCLQPSSAATCPSTGGGGPGPSSLGLSPVSSRPPLRHAHPRGGEVRVLPASDCLLSPAVLRCDMPIHGGGGEVRVLPASDCLLSPAVLRCDMPIHGGGGGGGPGPSSLGLSPVSSRPPLRHAHPRGGGPGPPSLGLSPVSSRPPLRHAHPRGEVRVLPASDCLLSPAVLRCDMPIHGGGGRSGSFQPRTVSCLQPSSAATCPSTGGEVRVLQPRTVSVSSRPPLRHAHPRGRSGSSQPRTVSCLQPSSAATYPSTGGGEVRVLPASDCLLSPVVLRCDMPIHGGGSRVLPASDCLLSPAVLRCDMPIHGGGEVRVLPASDCLLSPAVLRCDMPIHGGGGGPGPPSLGLFPVSSRPPLRHAHPRGGRSIQSRRGRLCHSAELH